ncbi:MAG: hypothetical protein D6728_07720 [Cyanobacteria bacterium J055]|nr:MAG: hypothetical protein D6728_07720 [Cyanobacteria bacterium J055]
MGVDCLFGGRYRVVGVVGREIGHGEHLQVVSDGPEAGNDRPIGVKVDSGNRIATSQADSING